MTGHIRRATGLRILVCLVFLLPFLGLSNTSADESTPVPFVDPWPDGAVCYEVFVRSFADSDGDGFGDLVGLTDRLDYLNDGDPSTTNDLGVNCVWLMPVFAATSYHGYDTEDYYAIEPDYGSEADFDRFVDEAHRRGIKVVLDLVLNHTSVEHPWFQAALIDPASPYRDWYVFAEEDPGYPGPWGAQAWHPAPEGDGYYYGVFWEGMPDLNYRNPEVTAEAQKIATYWIDRGVDGFRMDAIKHLIENGPEQENTPETHEWLRGFRAYLDETAPGVMTIGEIFNAGSAMLRPYFPDQLHRYFDFEIAGQLIIAAQQGVGDGLSYLVGEALEAQPDARWGTFLTNHDQNRAMTQLDGDVEAAKLAATALLTLPGLPFIWAGEEIGMRGAKPDERIRSPMQWAPGPEGGFTTGTPWQPIQDEEVPVSVATQDADPDSLLNHYRALVNLRVATPALSTGDYVEVETNSRAVLAFLRTSGEQTVLVVINFGDEPALDLTLEAESTPLAAGERTLSQLFGAAAESALVVSTDGEIVEQPAGFTLNGRSAVVYSLR